MISFLEKTATFLIWNILLILIPNYNKILRPTLFQWLATLRGISTLRPKNPPRNSKTMTAVCSQILMDLTCCLLFAVFCSIKTGLSLVNQQGPHRCRSTSDAWRRTCCCSSAPPALPHSCYTHVFPVCGFYPGGPHSYEAPLHANMWTLKFTLPLRGTHTATPTIFLSSPLAVFLPACKRKVTIQILNVESGIFLFFSCREFPSDWAARFLLVWWTRFDLRNSSEFKYDSIWFFKI
jgi:hypothetical protein